MEKGIIDAPDERKLTRRLKSDLGRCKPGSERGRV
jgi:hypothetical protein